VGVWTTVYVDARIRHEEMKRISNQDSRHVVTSKPLVPLAHLQSAVVGDLQLCHTRNWYHMAVGNGSAMAPG
jgi:hypothetical protein